MSAMIPVVSQPEMAHSSSPKTTKSSIAKNEKPIIYNQLGQPKPVRPLSAYNIFFKQTRAELLASTPTRPEGKPRRSHGKIGFAEMARTIAGRWNNIEPNSRQEFDALAKADKDRYVRELAKWKQGGEPEDVKVTFSINKRAAPSEQVTTHNLSLQSMMPSFRPRGSRDSGHNQRQKVHTVSLVDIFDCTPLPGDGEERVNASWDVDPVVPHCAHCNHQHQPQNPFRDLALRLNDDCLDLFLDLFHDL